MGDLISTNLTIQLSNSYIEAVQDVRIQPTNGTVTYGESNVFLKGGTPRTFNSNVTSDYGISFGKQYTAPNAVGFGDSYSNLTSLELFCKAFAAGLTNWTNATGNTDVC